MVRTQLYLPDDMYESLKAEAKLKSMSFAQLVRIRLEMPGGDGKKKKDCSKKALHRAFPFLKLSESIKVELDPDDLDNEALDKAIYGF